MKSDISVTPPQAESALAPSRYGALAQLRSAQLWAVALSLGAITMMWTTYDQYVPQFLRGTFGVPALFVVLVLTTDNVLGFFMEPLTGLLSDRTRSTLGKRLPWILLGMPIAVGFFALIPIPLLRATSGLLDAQSALRELNPFMLYVIGMLVAMTLFRTPTVALMPDLASSPGRSVANGLLQTVSGLGALGAFFIGGWLVSAFNPAAPFWVASLVMILAALFLWFVVSRQDSGPDEPSTPYPSRTRADILRLMGAITFWWLGFVFLRNFVGDVASSRWGDSDPNNDLYAQLFLFGFTIGAIPAGLAAGRFGRRRTVRASTLGMMALIAILAGAVSTTTQASLLLVVAGLGWAGVTVNNLPMLLDLGPEGRLGTSTGLYYLSFALAGLSGPWLANAVRPWIGSGGLWLVIVWWLAALAAISAMPSGAGEVERNVDAAAT